MSITLVYKQNGKQKEATLNNEMELGKFVIYNEPMEVLAVRVENKCPLGLR